MKAIMRPTFSIKISKIKPSFGDKCFLLFIRIIGVKTEWGKIYDKRTD